MSEAFKNILSKIKKIDECNILMNRYRDINESLFTMALKRRCEIVMSQNFDKNDPLISDLCGSVEAYTILLYEKHNKNYKPIKLLQEIAHLGERESIGLWMASKDAKECFFYLILRRMPEYTFEYLTIRFKEIPDKNGKTFTAGQVLYAKKRLADKGFDIDVIKLYGS
jgi:hypothetical protein